jgi:hypothetical protein
MRSVAGGTFFGVGRGLLIIGQSLSSSYDTQLAAPFSMGPKAASDSRLVGSPPLVALTSPANSLPREIDRITWMTLPQECGATGS